MQTSSTHDDRWKWITISASASKRAFLPLSKTRKSRRLGERSTDLLDFLARNFNFSRDTPNSRGKEFPRDSVAFHNVRSIP